VCVWMYICNLRSLVSRSGTVREILIDLRDNLGGVFLVIMGYFTPLGACVL
jgi:hypothetical protein